MKLTWPLYVGGFAALALFVAGCSPEAKQPPQSKDTSAAKEKEKTEGEHGHKPGRHGGTIIEIGRDNYHAEATFGEKGLVRLHLLGKDEAQVQEVEQQTLAAYGKAEGDTKGVEFMMEPKPRPDDSKGKTSIFEGTLPESLRDKRVEVTVTTIRIEGGRFRFAFKNFKEGETHGTVMMPRAISGEKMKALYATAKGKYTEADIEANGGGKTAADVYGNEMTEHDDNPQPGDKICPISKTKANPKVSWIIGGKKYEFCCTPCINEFVKKAQEKPDQVKDPSFYVKQ